MPNNLRLCLYIDPGLGGYEDGEPCPFICEPCLYVYDEQSAGPANVVSYALIEDLQCTEGSFDGYEITIYTLLGLIT